MGTVNWVYGNRGTRGRNGGLWLRGFVRLIVAGVLIGGLLFGGAGTPGWSRGWLFLGLLLGTLGVNLVVLLSLRPELMRNRWERKEGTKGFDKVFALGYFLSVLVLFFLAGMDAGRFGWTSMAEANLYPGVALYLMGAGPILWSLLENPFLETTVRIQGERGHRVITTGPYRIIRHPMYLGACFMFLGWPLILGSWVAFGVSCFIVVLLVARTHLEDQTLRQELDGYTDYSRQTRYRLIPGLW